MKHHRPRTWNDARRLLASLMVVMLVSGAARAEAASLSLSWNAPTTNADGTPLIDLAGYHVYLGTSPPPCPSAAGGWVLHGRYTFDTGSAGYVQTDDSSGAALADAVRFVPVP